MEQSKSLEAFSCKAKTLEILKMQVASLEVLVRLSDQIEHSVLPKPKNCVDQEYTSTSEVF